MDRIGRVIDILDYIASSNESRRVTDISKHFNMHKSSVSRILARLEELGWLAQAPDSSYRLHVKSLEFALSVVSGIDIKNICRPHLVELNRATKETTGLLVPVGMDSILMDQVECVLPLRYVLTPGSKTPLWLGAPGKTMLAYLDEHERNEIIAEIKKSKARIPTTDEPVDVDSLLHELDEVRRLGYLISTRELTPVCLAAASPIFDQHDKVVGSILLTGPNSRFNKKNAPRFAMQVKKTAQQISKELGSRFQY